LWPVVLVVIGVALLLDNFLLLGEFRVTTLLPLALVLAGAQILLRGDLSLNSDARTFGITRGSVESATLEVSSGEVDVQIRALQREGRLIAGQFAAASRPAMRVTDAHAYLKMDRASTPWLSLANWEMGIAHGLPWQVLVSTSLGQIHVDLSGLIVQGVVLASGIGDIRFVCPQESLGPVALRSALGNIHIMTPIGCPAHVIVKAGRLFKVHADPNRYHEISPGLYEALNADAATPLIEITVQGVFGDTYLT
jgi:hypothetical protein